MQSERCDDASNRAGIRTDKQASRYRIVRSVVLCVQVRTGGACTVSEGIEREENTRTYLVPCTYQVHVNNLRRLGSRGGVASYRVQYLTCNQSEVMSQIDHGLRADRQLIELGTNSIRLAGKAFGPAGGPFIVLLPAGGPAVGPFVSFRATIVCKCFIGCCRSFSPQQPLLLTTSADFVSYLVPNFHRYTTALSPKLLPPPSATPRRRRRRCCCWCLLRKFLNIKNRLSVVMISPSLSFLLHNRSMEYTRQQANRTHVHKKCTRRLLHVAGHPSAINSVFSKILIWKYAACKVEF